MFRPCTGDNSVLFCSMTVAAAFSARWAHDFAPCMAKVIEKRDGG